MIPLLSLLLHYSKVALFIHFFFLIRNANVECRTKKGCTPFFLSSKEGFKEISVMLVKHGADTEVSYSIKSITYFMCSDCFQATDQRGITPLLAAFRNGHVEVCRVH